ncbi:MAG: glycerol-3-phosphate 1-O-acyltransferase PlsY [bacterium]|nr:glycerol-3-phosphate 1-O-acyltransferase PlsY [bacterium]
MPDAWTFVAIALSYVVGSIPTGLWLGLGLRRVDIRQHGSKNIGATNTLRVLGKGLGALALAGDAGKGIVPVLLIARLSEWPYAALVCGVAAIVGHVFPIFLTFKGGKGLATSAGVFLALCPVATLIAFGAFFGVVAVTRMVSAGSVTAAVVFSALLWTLPYEWATYPTHSAPRGPVLAILATLVAALIVVRHRSNIARILKGQENRL